MVSAVAIDFAKPVAPSQDKRWRLVEIVDRAR